MEVKVKAELLKHENRNRTMKQQKRKKKKMREGLGKIQK